MISPPPLKSLVNEGTQILAPWIVLWLFVSGIICTIDVVYTMNRPFTNDPNRYLARTIFSGWALYSTIDRHYLTTNDVITTSTGRVMLIEIVLNFLAIGLSMAKSRHAILVAFTSTVMVLWKTVLFFSFFILPPEGDIPMNSNKGVFKNFGIFWVPNGVWIVMPSLVLLALWNKLALPHRVAKKFWEQDAQLRGELTFRPMVL